MPSPDQVKARARLEGILTLVAAFFVLFTAMLSPLLSASLAIALLVAMGVYKLFQNP